MWKKITASITLLSLLVVAGIITLKPQTASASCGSGYSYCRQIVLDHTKIGGGTEDETYYPWEASSTIASIATVGNGGHVQNTTTQTGSSYTSTVPADLIFTSDSACTTKLNWEFESYNSATGKFIAWIANSSTALSHTSDTIVYLCYGKSSVTTWQGNVNGTWNSGFVLISHLPNGSTLNVNDSTSNANNGTGTTVTATTGQVDGAVGLTNVSTSNVDYGNNASLQPVAITYSGWVKGTTLPNTYNTVISEADAGHFVQLFVTAFGKVAFYVGTTGGTVDYDGTGTHTLSTATWYYLTATYSSAAGLAGYVNGASDATVGSTGNPISTLTENLQIGNDITNSGRNWNGTMDEIRVSNIVRSVGWVSTDYNNQSAPDKANYSTAGFYTVGSEQSSGATPATPVANMTILLNGHVDIKNGGSLKITNNN